LIFSSAEFTLDLKQRHRREPEKFKNRRAAKAEWKTPPATKTSRHQKLQFQALAAQGLMKRKTHLHANGKSAKRPISFLKPHPVASKTKPS
jgi:hypothetical protein